MPSSTYSLKAIKDIGRLSSDGLMVVDVEQGKILYCNKALSRILHKSMDDIKEQGVDGLRKLLTDDTRFLTTAFRQLQKRSTIINLELRVAAEHNKYISLDAYLLNKGKVIVVFGRDITSSKEHLNYITEFGARKNTLLDMVAHNLSGPLNLTNNLLDVIDQAGSPQLHLKIDGPARLIRENTQQCIDIINSFLREEHVTSPKIAVEANRFDVMTKIDVIVERYRQFAPTKQIIVTSEMKQLFVTGDDVKFFQVINNIISNAIKFTDSKGKIIIEVTEQAQTFRVSVQDNGIGIPEYLQPYLFAKNTPAGRPGLRGENSIGMGLYIVKKLVDMMKGSITFQSEEGRGTTFMVELPKIY